MTSGFLAPWRQHCPLCRSAVVPNRSRILPLPVSLYPDPDRCDYAAERKRGWQVDGRPTRWDAPRDGRPKFEGYGYAHAPCVERFQRKYSLDEQERIAEERRCELVRKKADALREHREAEAALRKRVASKARRKRPEAR